MKIVKRNNFSSTAALISLVFAHQTANAIDYTGEIRAGVGVSDNIGRTAALEVDETIAMVGFDFGMTELTSRLELNLRSSFDYIDYLDDTFEAEWVGGVEGTATFTLIDERLRWVFEDNYGQQLFDPLEAARPDNRENINFFTTGPTLNLVRGERLFVTADVRYSILSYELQPSDNKRKSGALSVGRDTSRESRVSLNLTSDRIEFDDPVVGAPIDLNAVFVRYEKDGLTNTLGVDLGFNQAESAGSKGDGLLLQVDWTKTTSANGQLSMTGGSRYSDQGNIFRLFQARALDVRDTNDLPDATLSFLNNFYTVAYFLTHDRYSVDLSAGWNQEDYEGQTAIDRDAYFGGVRLQREVTRKVFANANIGFQRRDFKYIVRRDDDLTLGFGVGYRLTNKLSLALEYQHFQRNSIQDEDFTENRAFLRIVFLPLANTR